MNVDDAPVDRETTAPDAIGLLARRVVLLVLAASVMILAIVIAGRNAPRTSGDLVQLWLVPVENERAEVGLRNGIAADLDCVIVLETGGGDVERLIEISSGDTYREFTSTSNRVTEAIIGARAQCQAEGQRFNREVWLAAETAP